MRLRASASRDGGGVEIEIVWPHSATTATAEEIRTFARGVEALGYAHVLVYDHVLGADPAVHQGWAGPYDIDTPFREPLVLLGFVAGCTALGVVTGILILPQRQTALVAKQAAELDLLTDGRLRLGVGIGWNAVEYEALGERFSTRARRIEAQVALLRRLWTERTVSERSEFDLVPGAGLCPAPVQRPIPIWFGARTPPAYERAGRLGDGWLPLVQPGPRLSEALGHVRAGAERAGRDPGAIGMQGRVDWRGDVDNVAAQVEKWRDSGASHLGISTMGPAPASLDAHLERLEVVAKAIL